MRAIGVTAIAAALLAAGLTVGCGRDGAPVSVRSSTDIAAATATTTKNPASSTSAAASSENSTAFELPAFGVEPTTRTALAPDAETCAIDNAGDVTFGARVADPAAPVLTIGVPNGFLPSSGDADVAATMAGPDGMSATVTIAATDLDPAAAFKQYGENVTAGSEFSSISVLPGDLCGYSGQKLMGNLADKPGKGVEFRDRIAHIWTNTKNYLVAIHLQGPAAAAGFDDAEQVLMADFGIRIP
jgi:hypothetical protein